MDRKDDTNVTLDMLLVVTCSLDCSLGCLDVGWLVSLTVALLDWLNGSLPVRLGG